MGLFTKDVSYKITYFLADKNFDTTEIKEYDKIKSLEFFLEKENYSFSEAKEILASSNPFDTAFNNLRNPKSNILADEYDRMKKIIILNTIEGLENNEQKYSTMNSIIMYFAYLVCLRYGVSFVGEKSISISDKKQFIIELSTNNPRSLMWFDDKIAVCIALYIKKFRLSLPEFADELMEAYRTNAGVPKQLLGSEAEFSGIVFKLLEMLCQKKKYRISTILK